LTYTPGVPIFSGSISPGSTISLTSTIVIFEAVAIAGLNALDVPIYSKLPKVSDLFALMSEKSDKGDNVILKEFEKGYKYNDKILRHSKVVVSKS